MMTLMPKTQASAPFTHMPSRPLPQLDSSMLKRASKKISKTQKLSSGKNSKVVNRYQTAMSSLIANATQETSNASHNTLKKTEVSLQARMLVRAQKYAPGFSMPTKPLKWKKSLTNMSVVKK